MSWQEEVDLALRTWHSIESRRRSDNGYSRVGKLRAHGTGWRVDTRRGNALAQAERFIIGGETQSSLSTGLGVAGLHPEGAYWRVQPVPGPMPEKPYLWAQTPSAAKQVESLRQRLADLKAGKPGYDLVTRLAEGRAGGSSAADARPPAGLPDRQEGAWRACLGTGVWLVWGPPGTGKTTVLRKALGSLIDSGHRVLIAAATNVAVDNTLAELVRPGQEAPDEVVRIGQPHVPAISSVRNLQLDHKVDVRIQRAVDHRDQLRLRAAELLAEETELSALTEATPTSAIEQLGWAQAQTMEGGVPAAARIAEQWNMECSRVAGQVTENLEALASASNDVEQAAASKSAWLHIDALQKELRTVQKNLDRSALVVAAAGESVQQSAERLRSIRGWRRKEKTAAGAEYEEALRRQGEARDAAAAWGRWAEEERARIEASIGELTSAATVSRADCRRRQELLGVIEDVRDQLAATVKTVTVNAEHAHEKLADVTKASAILAEAEKSGIARKIHRLGELQSSQAGRAALSKQTRSDLRQAEQQVKAQRPAAEREVLAMAQVVAMTLAKLRTMTSVTQVPFDVVFVDEAAAATLPDILLAVGQGTRCAVLFGDPRQLGPVFDSRELANSDDPAIQAWLQTNPFAHCGIDGPETATLESGCFALDVQHRFGPVLTKLANKVAYDGLLRAQKPSRRPDDPEIILVDTQGMGELADVKLLSARSGWWSAGPLLSRVLARIHLAEGNVGIVTPFSVQAELTWEALRDVEGDEPLAEVGTAHKFQGREFDTLIFDTVEGDTESLWMALAQRNGKRWNQDGARLFNVAVTRARNRLYIIVDTTKLSGSKPGDALYALQELRLQDQVRVISGAALLGIEAASEEVPDDLFERMQDVLGEHVRISRVDDERTYFPALLEYIDAASESIYLWAPWIAKRLEYVRPALEAARNRGVEVIIFVRGETDTLQAKTRMLKFLQDLRASQMTVIAVFMMHEKIVVIDHRLVLLGSLNTLSQSNTREVMVTMTGRHFARRLLEKRRIDTFVKTYRCPSCQSEHGEFRLWKKGWFWVCIIFSDGKRCRGKVSLGF
ncbi:hypothetical protein GCM10022223_42990 [Kineosporia mesophila]|uniref:PLD phosphodiesterase domain-containing protein n=1 Tax=Kineosporia mesophila TaxID=566012 RepID=A0ABP6ZWY2_9ACTN|nr:AAA domain-containing protein [Kineosporia mesophila]MCD5353263.1 AAA domain-containing protein [Kineosporia mesophila]